MASFSPLLRTTISRLLFFPQICHTLPHDATSRLLGLQSSWRKREPSHSGKSGNYLRRPRPLLPPSCGRGVGSPAHRRPGLPLGLRPPPLLPSQGLYSLAVFFLPPSTSPLSKIMAVVTETTLLAAHLPSSIALLFFFFGSSSQPNFLESVYTSCFHFLTCRSLSSPFQPGFHSASST